MPRGRHSIDRAGYADDIVEYTDEIRDGVAARMSGYASVTHTIVDDTYSEYPLFRVVIALDSGEVAEFECIIGIDDDGDIVADISTYDVDPGDWEVATITASVNDDGSIATGDMSADVTAIVDAVDTLKRRYF